MNPFTRLLQLLPIKPFTDNIGHGQINIKYLGRQINYPDGMAKMRAEIGRHDKKQAYSGTLLLLEHSDTITVTRQYGDNFLLVSREELQNRNINLLETDRGGDITFHGTGQLVGYFVLRLEKLEKFYNLMGYLEKLERSLLSACHALGLTNSKLIKNKTGIWVGNNKLIAIGVGVSKGISRHGFALNISTNLEKFTDCIIPCGLRGMGVTSLEREFRKLNQPCPSFEETYKALKQAFKQEFTKEDNIWPTKSSCHNWASPLPKAQSLNG